MRECKSLRPAAPSSFLSPKTSVMPSASEASLYMMQKIRKNVVISNGANLNKVKAGEMRNLNEPLLNLYLERMNPAKRDE